MHDRTMNNLKENLYHESNNKKNKNIENDDSVMLYVCKVCMLFKKSHIINLLLTSTAWPLRENIRPRSFLLYGQCTVHRSDIFR